MILLFVGGIAVFLVWMTVGVDLRGVIPTSRNACAVEFAGRCLGHRTFAGSSQVSVRHLHSMIEARSCWQHCIFQSIICMYTTNLVEVSAAMPKVVSAGKLNRERS